MKRAAAFLIAAVIAAININFTFAAENYAMIELGADEPSCVNVTKTQYRGGTYTNTTVGGEKGTEFSNTRFEIDIASSFMRRLKNGEGVDVTVKYFDSGDGSFVLEYDGRKDACEYSDAVYLTGSGEWKTKVFHLYDAYFSNRINNTDLAVCLSADAIGASKENVIFQSIKIEKSGKVFPINMTEKPLTVGNIFQTGEKSTVSFSAENILTENISAEYDFSVVNSYGETVKNGSGECSFKSGENTLSIDSGVTACGAYEMTVKIYNDENLYGEVKSNFAIVVDAEENDIYGQNTHYRIADRDTEKSLPLVKKMGAGMIRDELIWSSCETEKGKINVPQSWIDMAESANEKGLTVLGILGYTNSFYDNGKFPTSDEALTAYGKYVYEVVSKLKGKIDIFEVYNEFHHLANRENLVAADYVKLLKVTYEQAKQANPQCTIVGLSGLPGVWAYWVDDMLKAGAADYMDALSLHEYDAYGAPERLMMRWIKDVKNYMSQNACSDIPIWITETGWSTGNICSDLTVHRKVSESEQYKCGIRQYVQYMELGIAKYFWYDFKNDGMNRRDEENSFGTIYNNNDKCDTPYSAKPSYVAFTNMNDKLANAKVVSHTCNSDETEIFKFRKENGEFVWVMWNLNGTYQTDIKTGTSGLVFYDVFGNAKKVSESNGTYTVTVSDEPVYLAKEKEPTTDTYEINYQTGEITVTVVGLDTKKYCAIEVLKPGKTAKDVISDGPDAVAYIAQPKSKIHKFVFDAKDEGIYNIYVNNGSELKKIGAAYYKPFEVKLKAFQNGQELKDMSSADKTKSVIIRAEISNTSGSNSGYIFACAGYEAGVLKGISTGNAVRLDESKASDTIDIEISDISGIDTIKAFFWRDNTRLIPMTDKFEIK